MSSSCQVIHIAMTPLAGSPIRIVQALNTYTGVSARLFTANEYPPNVGRVFPTDLRGWVAPDREEFLSVLEKADIIHLHHWMDLDRNPLGIKFSNYLARGKKIIRQFHSNPNFVAHHAGLNVETILRDPLPQLTLPQLHERFYPRARLVPNIVPIDDALYTVTPLTESRLSVYYRPSGYASAWAERWETKGAPEVMNVLNWSVKHIPNLRVDAELTGLAYEEHVRRRATCHLAIDDVVTGSFHLSSLETLAQGRAALCYLDARQLLTLAKFTNCHELPFINFPLEDLAGVLDVLSKNLTLVQALGVQGRAWMERYWHPKAMAEHYVSAYDDLLTDEMSSFSKPRFNLADPTARWQAFESEDIRWLLRRARQTSSSKASI